VILPVPAGKIRSVRDGLKFGHTDVDFCHHPSHRLAVSSSTAGISGVAQEMLKLLFVRLAKANWSFPWTYRNVREIEDSLS
jgi:hypothetical protein